MIDSKFSLETVGKIPSMGWKHMQMFSLDHKNGYFHVSLHPSSFKYFYFIWGQEAWYFPVLSFGWKPCAFIYSTIQESLASYVRKVTLAPLIIYIDDSWGANPVSTQNESLQQQWLEACKVIYVLCVVSNKADFFSIERNQCYILKLL